MTTETEYCHECETVAAKPHTCIGRRMVEAGIVRFDIDQNTGEREDHALGRYAEWSDVITVVTRITTGTNEGLVCDCGERPAKDAPPTDGVHVGENGERAFICGGCWLRENNDRTEAAS